MFQLIKLGNCIHIFDREQGLFVKLSMKNLKKALEVKETQSTRLQIIESLAWVQCTDPHCRVKNCRQQHWIAQVQKFRG